MVVLNYDDWFEEDFDLKLEEKQVEDFFVDTLIEEGNLERNQDTEKAIRFIVQRFDYINDDEMLEVYKDEMLEYFESDAEEEYERMIQQREDEKDWYGTKSNVVGV